MPSSDFNYKVALASGLRSLQAGQPQKAEEQFRYLREKFPRADGGYRGLAKVRTEAGDTEGALSALRDGASVLAKAGERAAAIGLLREILTLDAVDLRAHRQLAAALILSGDRKAAVDEYDRYVQLVLQEPGGAERAQLEVDYAREQLGESSELVTIAAWIVGAPPTPPASSPVSNEAPAVVVPPLPPVVRPVARVEHGPEDIDDDLERRAMAAIAARDVSAHSTIVDAVRAHVRAQRIDAAADLLAAATGAGITSREIQGLQVEVAASLHAGDVAREGSVLLGRLGEMDANEANERPR